MGRFWSVFCSACKDIYYYRKKLSNILSLKELPREQCNGATKLQHAYDVQINYNSRDRISLFSWKIASVSTGVKYVLYVCSSRTCDYRYILPVILIYVKLLSIDFLP